MPTLFNILLIIHIFGGGLSLILGLLILLSKKGNQTHRKIGLVYFYTMLIASLVALPMSYMHTNYFLFIIGIFSTYMLLTGVRYLRNKNMENIKLTDWLISGMMLLFGLAFVILGTYNIIN